MPIRLVAFDLDDTLAPSKSPLPGEVAAALRQLLDRLPVCVISGCDFPQFEQQLLTGLAASPEQLDRLHLMPTCGTRYFRREGDEWRAVYRQDLSGAEKQLIAGVLEEEARRLGLWEVETWGDAIEDRDSQITFSALGQGAPLDAKHAWDPSGAKRAALASAAGERLLDFEVRSGGSTSVDVTRRGIDKAYGMAKLVEQTGIAGSDMLFIGDRLDEGGNDFPVKAAGYPTKAVGGWSETPGVIAGVIAELEA